MIISQRTLHYAVDNSEIRVKIFEPVQEEVGWSCAYEIGWPEGPFKRSAHGIDSMQALILAIYSIGSDLHTSQYNKQGLIFYHTPGRGLGFPVANPFRDELVGDDLEFF